MRGVIAGVLLAAAIVACGGQQHVPGIPAEREEIQDLWMQIRGWRAQVGLRVDPASPSYMQFKDKSVVDAKLVCPEIPDPPKACDDVCGLGDAICDNADRICVLADKLGKDDRFAQDKCASAKASCHESKQRCCECSEKEKPQ